MIKYYTRACNFYYGNQAKKLIKNKKALPLCGNSLIAFDRVELLSRKNKIIKSKQILLKDIRNLNFSEKKVVKENIKNITSKRRNFLKNVDFSKPSIMGILNLTPDSFSDGGKFNNDSKSFRHISNMIYYGANIIDVGGESTRPGSKSIKPKFEWKRVKSVIKNFKRKYKNVCLSFDTRKSDLMVQGIENGVDLINDVSGFSYDKKSLSNIKNYNVVKVLHHMQGTPNTMQINPKYENVLLDIYDFFENKINKSFNDKKIILDPGIGFGKTLKHNLTLISKISLFHSLGLPILIGTSRKRFINQISGKNDSKERIGGTLASVLFLLSQGVQIFRVHDVKEIKQGILVFEKLLLN
ncbi:MAG: dihydropteroate synthase [Pseudomonadota bacterium]|nr:dihydropteroate synthase [Pseudomonadota bacterium]